jgi:hypothetical protein
LRGAERESESSRAVGVAAGSAGGAIDDLAGIGNGAVEGMKVFADVAGCRDLEFAVFEGGAEAREEFGLESGREFAEFEANGARELPEFVSVVAKLVRTLG